LEPYRERYTMQLSAPKTGWMERNWIKAGVEFVRIAPHHGWVNLEEKAVKIGVVLDPVRRTRWAFGQVKDLLELAVAGKITDGDTIYLDDFWHPGFEQLPYTFHQLGIKPKMYAYCWAQSVDVYDFTFLMRSWIRHFERGIGATMDGVFVACPTLKKLLSYKWSNEKVIHESKVHAVGLPWCTEEVMERMPGSYRRLMGISDGFSIPQHKERKNQVVFSSRWDQEKNPEFFIEVARAVKNARPDVTFVVCTSAPTMRSNGLELLSVLSRAYDDQVVEVHENLSKEEYYAILCESKVQFNCASQDWVSFTLLEASAAGCFPVYPKFRSFPETLLDQDLYMYEHLNVESAAAKVLGALASDCWWTPEAIRSRSWIHTRFDTTWQRQAQIMGLVFPTITVRNDLTPIPDPFDAKGWL
jgi:glycosyltransferase involved in cell wall biosynthesis